MEIPAGRFRPVGQWTQFQQSVKMISCIVLRIYARHKFEIMTQSLESDSKAEQVKLIHSTYLDSVYSEKCDKYIYTRIAGRAKYIDLSIALGTALGGVSGLAILKNENFAIPCAVLTILSVVMSIIKQVNRYAERQKQEADLVTRYSVVAARLGSLIDDLNIRKTLIKKDVVDFEKLRRELNGISSALAEDLPIEIQRSIMSSVIKESGFKQWWRPYVSATKPA